MHLTQLSTLGTQLFEKERGRLILWVPVTMMAGIGLYFALPTEPWRWLGPVLAAGFWLPMLALRRRLLWLFLPLFLISLGFACVQWRTQAVAAPLLKEELRFREVEAVIGEIITTEEGAKLVLERPAVEGLAPEKTPRRIRVSLRKYDPAWEVGDHVRMKATLFPLPRPAYPGGYDFGRYFYYQGIGAIGFAPRPPEVVERAQRSAFGEWLSELRHRIGERLRSAMPGAEGAVAAALTVGEMGAIPKQAGEEMRVSGLSHILSISGLHLALASGIVFFAVRLLVALVPRIALRVQAKKIAAGFALLSAFAYLMLSGAPVPAQRSFVMVAFTLTAVLIDRKGISLNALAWAAVLVLLFFPEAMTGASFQMSFAATLAIISLYERYGHRLYRAEAKWYARIGYVVLGGIITSLVASLATAPFVIYHFNRLSVWGVLANLLVMPLTSLLIMPGVVLTFLTLPFGTLYPGAWLMEWGIRGMLLVAQWVSALPLASVPVPSMTDFGLVLAALGLLVLTLLRSRMRRAGFVLIALGLATMSLQRAPDIFMSDDLRQVMVRAEDGNYVLLRGANRGFTVQAWLRTVGQDKALTYRQWEKKGSGEEIICDKSACIYVRNNHRFAYVKQRGALDEACDAAPELLASWWEQEGCAAKGYIAKPQLARYGAVSVRMEEAGPVLRTSYSSEQKRPWMLRPGENETDDDDSGGDEPSRDE